MFLICPGFILFNRPLNHKIESFPVACYIIMVTIVSLIQSSTYIICVSHYKIIVIFRTPFPLTNSPPTRFNVNTKSPINITLCL
jgi:hypothetical protein